MKQTIIWVVIIGAIIAGIFLYRARQTAQDLASATALATSTTGSNTTSGGAMTSGSNTTGSMKTTLGGIFDDPGSYQCDYEQVSQKSKSTNVVYIANGRLRGEFRTTTATTTTLSMMVYDGTNLYVWNEGQSTGTVSVPKTIRDLPGVLPEDLTSGRILGTSSNSVGWNCHAWSKDLTKLVKPSYVTFR